MRSVVTIGVYGFGVDDFVDRLVGADVGLLLDLRQRRGVRGHDYAWANSVRLQSALAAANIAYRHVKRLAPTTELRHVQYREDARLGVSKRDRVALAPEYVRRYTREILDPFDVAAFVSALPDDRAIALFCVERDPEACHRGLVADRLRDAYGTAAVNLRPADTGVSH